MAKSPPRHWLYEAYLALAAANGPYGLNLSESQGRDTIKGWFPQFSPYVNQIIDASGDLTKIPEHALAQSAEIINQEAMSRATEDMDRRIRYGAGRLRDGGGRFAKPLDQDGEEAEGSQNDTQIGDMNTRLRERRSKLDPDLSDKQMNTEIRRARDG
jgi:hypothetical protein